MTLKELFQKIGQNPQFKEVCVESYVEEVFAKRLLQNGSLQVVFAITNIEMEALYTEGYAYYQTGDYEKAGEVFRWLVILDTFNTGYWMGYSASQQLCGEYLKALHGYAIVSLLENESPYPHFHAHECYKALNDEKEAATALEQARIRFTKLGVAPHGSDMCPSP
jgi:type III secretion system low calcium response chaperone LcrH/SycD